MADKPHMFTGGGWLVEPVLSGEIPTREDITEDQFPYEKTAEEFMRKEVIPLTKEIESKKPGLVPSLIKKAGELGLLMMEIPEEYGGLGLTKLTTGLIIEKIALQASFNVSFGAHTGIGTIPIVYYGNDEQKKKYLPLIGSGEKLSCYALTEPYAGSDALSIKTTAKLSPDKNHYILNGTKQFITNAGFADIIITYAKIDGEKFTSFILEREYPGISIGPEEHKMGITGSSTCQVILEDVKVPAANLLGEIGKGHYIAFNTLNMGRFKLGLGAGGTAKEVLTEAVKYGLERKQFGTPVVQFGAIKNKIADVTVAIFVTDSITYRVAGSMDQGFGLLEKSDPGYSKKATKVIEEFAIEDSIIKVFGSEALDLAVDEGLQMLGGYGYITEYPLEGAFRDSRINRIFEGTNEINRLIIPGTIVKRAIKGQLPLMEAIGNVNEEIAGKKTKPRPGQGPLSQEACAVEMAKRVFLYTANQAMQRYGQDLDKQQQALMVLADMAMDIFGMDSLLGRVHKIIRNRGDKGSQTPKDIAMVYCSEGGDRIATASRRLLASLLAGNELEAHLKNVGEFFWFMNADVYSAKRRIADRVIADGGWNLSMC